MCRVDMRPYFAYGSNMDERQMRRRCPGATVVGAARLPDYRFIINQQRVASVVPHPGHAVYGVLWWISPANEAALDDYEGVEDGWYDKTEVQPVVASSERTSALIYIARDQVEGEPWLGYMANIVDSAVRCGLPGTYIDALRSWLVTAQRRSPRP